MKNYCKIFIIIAFSFFTTFTCDNASESNSKDSQNVANNEENSRWTESRVWDWYKNQPWLVGFNFLPSTAVNTTEMWQAETFDEITIDRELGWANAIGYNSCRVYLQYLVWKDDPSGHNKRLDRFLSIADKHNISVVLLLFDDCAHTGKQPYIGKQPEPTPGIHNSGWTPSPGHARVTDQNEWVHLERYVKDVIGYFSTDKRIVMWDLYNEPGASGMKNESLPLLEAAFRWAREINPEQPLTTGCWPGKLSKLNERVLELSDVITFHNYADLENLNEEISILKKFNRPMIRTEWLNRPTSMFKTHMPVFNEENIGCYNWGLVMGKMQTYYPWGSPEGAPEPRVWHHDILRPDGTPHIPEEIEIIRELTLSK